MATPAKDKYYLRSLHEEIDLFDRKLAHLEKFEKFASEKDRNDATGKLVAKRDLLVRNARQLVNDGIEFQDSDLPRSFRSVEPEVAPEKDREAEAPAPEAQRRSNYSPAYAGTALDFQRYLPAQRKAKAKL